MNETISLLKKVVKLVLFLSVLIIIISIILSFWNPVYLYLGIYGFIWGMIPATLVYAGLKFYEWKN